jgi:hypothetical protein
VTSYARNWSVFPDRPAARGTLDMRIPEWVQHAAVLTALAAAAVLVIAVL